MTPDDKPNTPMTPREYVDLIAGPTLAELLARRDDRRLAYLACLTVYHCADYLALAEAVRTADFNGIAGRARKRLVEAAAKAVRGKMEAHCGGIFKAVRGIANGTKHPDKLPHMLGSERWVGAYGFGPENVGFGEGRWGAPGLGLNIEGERGVVFLDHCAQQVLAAFVCAYPQHLGGIALSFMDWGLMPPGLNMQSEWLKWIRTLAQPNKSVAEVWLFGSRAKGTATAKSDVDLALVLMPAEQGNDRPLGDWTALATRWQADLEHWLGCHVSLELFARSGEEEGAPEARATAILLWQRAPTGWLDRSLDDRSG